MGSSQGFFSSIWLLALIFWKKESLVLFLLCIEFQGWSSYFNSVIHLSLFPKLLTFKDTYLYASCTDLVWLKKNEEWDWEGIEDGIERLTEKKNQIMEKNAIRKCVILTKLPQNFTFCNILRVRINVHKPGGKSCGLTVGQCRWSGNTETPLWKKESGRLSKKWQVTANAIQLWGK